MKLAKLVAATILTLSMCAAARPISGQVYGVFPEGVMVDYGGGSYLVPTQHATFELGGLRATWSSLQPGQYVDIVMPDRYWPNVQQIRDPYSWKMKNHPNHPHGGPPGQMKKGNPGRGNGNGKGRGKGKRR